MAVAVPPTRQVLADDRITGTGRAEAAFEEFVRIPIETAFAEEIIFRGVLLGLGLRTRSTPAAVVSSSIWFGLGHVYPTIGSIRRGAGGALVTDEPHRVGGATAGVVVSTAAAGALLAGLRLRSGSDLRGSLVVSRPTRVFLPVGRMPVRRALGPAPVFTASVPWKCHGPDPVLL